jgi:hypothetical protein
MYLIEYVASSRIQDNMHLVRKLWRCYNISKLLYNSFLDLNFILEFYITIITISKVMYHTQAKVCMR